MSFERGVLDIFIAQKAAGALAGACTWTSPIIRKGQGFEHLK
jgi:hypothetical protein